MNIVYVLSTLTEQNEEVASVEVTPYQHIEDALRAYSDAVDIARKEAENYEQAVEEDEVATDRYRWFRVADYDSCAAITIQVDAKVIKEAYGE